MKKFVPAAVVALALAILATMLVLPSTAMTSTSETASPPAARSTVKPPRPMVMAELAHMPSNDSLTRVRLVMPVPIPGVTTYRISRIDKSDGGKEKYIRNCSADSMRFGQGEAGCVEEFGPTYGAVWTVRAVRDGVASLPSAVNVYGLDGTLDGEGDSDGTTTTIMVAPSAQQAGAFLRMMENLGKDQAAACVKEAAWDKAYDMVFKAAAKHAKKKPNILTGAALALTAGVKVVNDESTDNPCQALAALAYDLARATVAAINDKKYKRVIVGAYWDTVNYTADACTISSDSPVDPANVFVLRPGVYGGSDERECWSFWGALVY